MSSAVNGSKAVTETGQIPRHIMEAYEAAGETLRESSEEGDSTSITGIFKMKMRAEGLDKKADEDTPLAGNVPAPAPQ